MHAVFSQCDCLMTALESEKKGRKAKHMDHYAGPAKIIKQIGNAIIFD